MSLYSRLGLDDTASQSDIKKAFHSLALLYHADKHPDSEPELWLGILEAYETLKDPESRATYDRTGTTADFVPSQNGHNQSFSFTAHQPPPRRRHRPKPEPTLVPLLVSLEELYTGKQFAVKIKKKVLCQYCKGHGYSSTAEASECRTCAGAGQIRTQQSIDGLFIQLTWITCPKCSGHGKSFRDADRCKACKGECSSQVTTKLLIDVQPSMHEGSVVVAAGQGDQEPNCDEPADIIFKLQIKPHPLFSMQASDLTASVTITLSEMLFGFDRFLLTHLDGQQLRVSLNQMLDPGQSHTVRIANQGLFRSVGSVQRGDLFLELRLDQTLTAWVETLSPDQLAVFRALLPPKRPDLGASDAVNCAAQLV